MQRALLIDSQTSGLKGCNGDVTLFRGLLALYGFKSDDIDEGTEVSATRQRILDGLARHLLDPRIVRVADETGDVHPAGLESLTNKTT